MQKLLKTRANTLGALKMLGIKVGVTGDEVKSAYRRKAKETHPDKGGTAQAFNMINTAYEYLARHGTIVQCRHQSTETFYDGLKKETVSRCTACGHEKRVSDWEAMRAQGPFGVRAGQAMQWTVNKETGVTTCGFTISIIV